MLLYHKSYYKRGPSFAPLSLGLGEEGVSASRLALCVAVAAAFLVVAFVPAPAGAAGPGGLYGGTVVVATTWALDPNPLNLSPRNEPLHSLLYDSLARPSPTTLVPEPWLATSKPDVNLTANTLTFHIRANAKWADGTPLTASDVNASYRRYLSATLVSGFSVIAPDPTTAVFTFTKSGGDFLGKWVTLPIAYTSSTSPAKASGLFDLGASTPTSLTITANANHWRGRPYPDAIRYEFHTGPAGLDEAACDLIEKRIDFLGVPLTSNDLTANRPCGKLQDPGNTSLAHIFTAFDPGFQFLHLGVNTARPPMDDAAFRVALTSALDRPLVRVVEGPGSTEVADSVVAPANGFWFNASVPQYRVEQGVEGGRVITILDNVNDMLDVAGYLDRNGDGWRETPAGAPFNVTFLHLNATADPKIAKVQGIVTNFRAIGVDLRELEASPADILAAARAGSFDLYLGAYDVEPDPSFLFDLFHTTRITSGRNWNRVSVPALDSVLEAVRNDLDVDARAKAARDAQGILAVEALAMPLVHYDTIYVYNRENYEGWVSQPGGIDNFWSFANLHVVPEGPLTVTVVPFTNSVFSGRTTSVIVTVRDAASLPVRDADVALSGGAFDRTTGVTDANGRFTATFTAPTVTQTQDATVRADVTKPGYDAASATTAITVHVIVQQLVVSVDRSQPILGAGETAAITVFVMDSASVPVAGANVTLALTPEGIGGNLSARTGTTAANGTFRVTLTSTAGTETTFRVTATASAPGYVTATAATSVLARMRGGAPPSVPALDTVTMVVVVAGAAFVFARWQTRRRKA